MLALKLLTEELAPALVALLAAWQPRFHLKCIKSWIQRCNSAGGLEFDWACPGGAVSGKRSSQRWSGVGGGCRYHRVDKMPECLPFWEEVKKMDDFMW